MDRGREDCRRGETEETLINKMMKKNRTSKDKMFVAYVRMTENFDEEKKTIELVNSLLNEYAEIINDDLPGYRDDIEFEHKIELTEFSIPKKRQYRLTLERCLQ